MKNKMLTLSEAAKYLGLHPKTMQRLDKRGVIKAHRTITNRRCYSFAKLKDLKKEWNEITIKSVIRDIEKIIRRNYGRVEP